MMSKMNDASDEEIMELVMAGQIIFAHKAIDSGYLLLEDAARLLGTDKEYLVRQFERLGLDYSVGKEMTFEELLNQRRPKEITYTAEEIRRFFLEGDI